jgi:hypothetical protein
LYPGGTAAQERPFSRLDQAGVIDMAGIRGSSRASANQNAPVLASEIAPALVRAGTEAFQQAGWEWLAFQRHSIERAVDSFSALWRCRTLKDLVDIQTQYVADVMEEGWTRGARVAMASIERTGDAIAAADGARRDLGAAGALPVQTQYVLSGGNPLKLTEQ